MKKKFFMSICTLLFAAALLFTGCGSSSGSQGNSSGSESDTVSASGESSSSSEKKKGTLKCAIELSYPPFDTTDEKGNPTGIDVDLIKAFGDYAGYDITIQDTSWDGLIPALQTGKADLVISAMSVTEERDELVDFSDPYAIAKIAILASADSKAQKDTDFDSKDITIAVKDGTVGHIYAKEHFPKAALTVLTDESACINEVLQGKADGFIYDELTCTNYHEDNPDKTKCISLSEAEAGGWAVAVKEGNTGLVAELNAFIKEYYESGELEKLGDKYMPGKREEFAENGFSWFFDLDY